MGYSITGEPPAQCVYGAKSTPLHETDTVPERYQEDENTCEIEAGSIYVDGFGMVASIVMRDKAISTAAKALYSYLMTFSNKTGEAWPTTGRILKEMNMSKPSFYKYRDELRDHGFIDWTTFGRKAGGRRTLYTIKMFLKPRHHEEDSRFSTMPSSEQWSKNFTIAPEPSNEGVEKWKTACGKPHEGKNSLPKYGKNSLPSNLNKPITTDKNSTTRQPADNSRLQQCGTANAEPVVSSPTAPSSSVDLDLKKNEEATLVRDSVDERFYALEARSLRRTGSPARKEVARLSYHRLVSEGHSPDDIDAVYDHYLRWVEFKKVQNPMGLPSFFEREDGWKLNYTQLMNEQTKTESSTQTGAPGAGKLADEADYRRRSAAVKSTLPDSDAECAYLFAYADSSDDQHLHDVAAQIRREEPAQYSNGYIDDRLSRRPSFPVLVRLVHSREHIRKYNETTYSALVAEGKIGG